MKEGIIVVNHGTLNHEVRLRCIEEFVLAIGDRLEDAEIMFVYTDGDIRRKLREETGEKVQNLKAAILGMKEKGVTHLTVVTTDVIAGEDYERLKGDTVALATLFPVTNISKPLLHAETDYDITARAINAVFGDLVGGDVLMLIAGGKKVRPAADELDIWAEPEKDHLKELEKAIRKHIPRTYISTLNGEKKPYKVIRELAGEAGSQESAGRIVLVPLEYLAGDGIENEVSREYDAVAGRLEAEGYTVERSFTGLAEYDDFQRLYMRHLYEARR